MNILEHAATQTPEQKAKRSIGGASGILYDVFNFQPWMINLHDIATGMSKKCRWNGQINTDEIFSVAQHSVYVSRLCGSDVYDRLAGLLHDASEGIMVDLITPLKRQMPDFRTVEDDVQDKIFAHFGIEMTEQREKVVATADRLCLQMESLEFDSIIHGEYMTDTKLFDFFTGDQLMGCKKAKAFWIAEFNSVMSEILTR